MLETGLWNSFSFWAWPKQVGVKKWLQVTRTEIRLDTSFQNSLFECHGTFWMSPLSHKPVSGLGFSTNELMSWIMCLIMATCKMCGVGGAPELVVPHKATLDDSVIIDPRAAELHTSLQTNCTFVCCHSCKFKKSARNAIAEVWRGKDLIFTTIKPTTNVISVTNSTHAIEWQKYSTANIRHPICGQKLPLRWKW